jgi:hypothetical protein
MLIISPLHPFASCAPQHILKTLPNDYANASFARNGAKGNILQVRDLGR